MRLRHQSRATIDVMTTESPSRLKRTRKSSTRATKAFSTPATFLTANGSRTLDRIFSSAASASFLSNGCSDETIFVAVLLTKTRGLPAPVCCCGAVDIVDSMPLGRANEDRHCERRSPIASTMRARRPRHRLTRRGKLVTSSAENPSGSGPPFVRGPASLLAQADRLQRLLCGAAGDGGRTTLAGSIHARELCEAPRKKARPRRTAPISKTRAGRSPHGCGADAYSPASRRRSPRWRPPSRGSRGSSPRSDRSASRWAFTFSVMSSPVA